MRGLGLAFNHYREQPQSGIAFQMKQFKLPIDLAEAGYRSSVKVAVRIEKAKTVTPAELRMVDDSMRLELVKEGLFKTSR